MSEWISVKKQLPPFHIFVEVALKDKIWNELHRKFLALVKGEDKDFWTSCSGTEYELGDFMVTHWKPMSPSPRGKIARLSVDRHQRFYVTWIKNEKMD